MGIQQSKNRKQNKTYPFNIDIKNGTTKEGTAKNENDFNHGKKHDFTENQNNIANDIQELCPSHFINIQMEPSNDKAAKLPRSHQDPSVHAPENSEHGIPKTINISQEADTLKHVLYLTSSLKVTEKHTYLAKPKNEETSTLATHGRPAAGHAHDVKRTPGKSDVLSDTTLQLQDVPEKLSYQQSRPPAQWPRKTNPTAPVQQTKTLQPQKQKTSPVQQQAKTEVTHGHTQPAETDTSSQMKPVAKETTLQTERATAPCDKDLRATAHPALNSEVFDSVQALCKDTLTQVEFRDEVRRVPTEDLHTEEPEAQAKAKITKLPSQKSSCVRCKVNKTSTDVTCYAKDKAHNMAKHSPTTKPGFTEVPITKLTEQPDNSAQISNQQKTQVNNGENPLHKHFNYSYVDKVITVDYHYCLSSKSGRSCKNAAKLRLRQKIENELKVQTGDGSKHSQQTPEETATNVPEFSQQKHCTAMEENKVKKHSEPHLTSQLNKAEYGNTSKSIQKVKVKAGVIQGPVVQGRPAAADTNAKLRLECEAMVPSLIDTAVKPKKRCTPKSLTKNRPKKKTRNVILKEEINGKNGQAEKERQEPAMILPRQKVYTEGRWHPFTVNQSCPRKLHYKHNPRTGLPLNIKMWLDEDTNHKCEPAWVTTARLAACLTQRAAG